MIHHQEHFSQVSSFKYDNAEMHGVRCEWQIVRDCISWLAVIPSVDILFVRFPKKTCGWAVKFRLYYISHDFLPHGSFSQMYTLICDLSWGVQNNFTVPFIFYPKLKRSQTDQHSHHISLTELLICVCHCTIHTRGQCKWHQDIFLHMLEYIILFCLHVQATSALIGLESGDGNG